MSDQLGPGQESELLAQDEPLGVYGHEDRPSHSARLGDMHFGQSGSWALIAAHVERSFLRIEDVCGPSSSRFAGKTLSF